MTDAALPADGGAVDNDAGGAPINDSPAGYTQPLGSQVPADAQDAGVDKSKPASIDDILDRAFTKSEKAEATAKAAPEKAAKDQPAKEAQNRGEGGKFAPKDGAKPDADAHAAAQQAKPTDQQQQPAKQALPSHTAEDPPARFAETAKGKWASADPEIRGEVLRMERELTQGFQKHKQSAEAYEPFRELDGIAKTHGKRGADVFREYYEMEQHLQKDLLGGLDVICQKMGVSLRDVAAHVLNQPKDQQTSQSDATIRELKQEIAGLKQQVGGVVQNHQQQAVASIDKEIASFKADPAHSRFDELANDIAFFLETRCPGNLGEAYKLAERLNPAPAADTNNAASSAANPAASSAPDEDEDLAAQTRKGTRSITGAPDPASTARGKKRASRSIDDALEAAFAGAR